MTNMGKSVTVIHHLQINRTAKRTKIKSQSYVIRLFNCKPDKMQECGLGGAYSVPLKFRYPIWNERHQLFSRLLTPRTVWNGLKP